MKLVLSTIAALALPSAVLSKGNNIQNGGQNGNGSSNSPFKTDYGELKPVADMATGLELLALPEGFSYISYGWTGQIMDDGFPTPTDHDGMAVVAKQGSIISMVRNHEMSQGETPLNPGPAYSPNEVRSTGGTTNLFFDIAKSEWVSSYGSLGGIIRPCAGGATPWGTWIAAEETFQYDTNGVPHGWLFDVPGFGESDAVPIRSAGRMNHEAAAVDPLTGYVYETEDSFPAGLYQYRQPGSGSPDWQADFKKGETLRDGGDLYVLKIVGEPDAELFRSYPIGTTWSVEWTVVPDPEVLSSDNRDAVFLSADGPAVFTRLEGIWWENGVLYFVSTNGGDGRLGQVFTYDPVSETLTLIYESQDSNDVWAPDNIAVSSNGNMILCEDGGSDPKRLIGLTLDGETFPFAENLIALNEEMLMQIDAVYPGTFDNFFDSVAEGDSEPRSFTSREWAGATFYGDWLFVNIQSPGVTFAITGPWQEGPL